MFLATVLWIMSFFLAAAAQSVVVVNVASGGLRYDPNNITAPKGTIVSFNFPKGSGSEGHSVTQTSFAAPCVYLPNGFNTGIVTTQSSINFTITDDTTPIWFYCREGKHCGMGMVGSINAPTTGNTFEAFHAAALALGTSEAAQEEGASAVFTGVGAQVAPSSTAPGSPSATGSSSSAAPSAKPSGSAAPRLTVNAGIALLSGIAAFFGL